MDIGKKGWLIGSAAGVVLIGGGLWFFVAKAPAPAPAPVAAVATAAPAAAAPAESLPTLENSDEWTRAKADGISGDARFKDWLKTANLLSRWAAAVNIVASGKVPADALSFLRPRRKFVPLSKDGRWAVAAASYARYDAVADAFASIDVPAAAAFFAAARPLLDRAWSALGEGSGDVLDGTARAARELLSAPTVPDRAELRPSEKGIVYTYADDALEARSPAQKQLMRMGRRNQLNIQSKIRELALAVGVPETKLR